MRRLTLLLISSVWLLPFAAWGMENAELKLGVGMKYFAEEGTELSLSEARERFLGQNIQTGDSEALSFGYSNQTFWFHNEIAAGVMPEESVLILGYPLIDYVELFVVQGETVTRFMGGDERVFGERPIESPDFVFPLKLSDNVATDIFLKVRTTSSFQVPVSVVSESSYFRRVPSQSVAMGMYFGIIFIMALYNFIIFTSTRERLFFLYVLYAVSWGLLQTTIRGYGYQYLWPDSPDWNSVAPVVVGNLAGVGMFGFCREFLGLRTALPKMDKVLKLGIGTFAISVLFAFWIPYSVGIRIFMVNCILMTFATIGAAVSLVRNSDSREPRFFLIAFGIFFMTGVVYALNKLGFLPRNFVTEHAVQLGEILQLALLSLGLADRLNTLQHEKQVTQDALDHSRLEVARQLERSDDLEVQNNALAAEMKLASQQLIQAEKLSSLGQQVAGILHEISSPLSHALAGARGTQKSKDELYNMLHGMVGEDEAAQEVWEALKKHFEEQSTQLGYVEVGLEKIREMNQAVRNYSRSDARSRSSENVRALVQEVCVVMRNKVKFLNMELDCEDLPAVSCHRSQFAQVFTNLIGNAADAIEERQDKNGSKEPEGHIRISGGTSVRDGKAGLQICVEDNGTGVPVELRDKIHEAFFTTKPIGKGTGLGMAITGRILKDHDAILSIDDSELGGAAFKIWLPSSVAEG